MLVHTWMLIWKIFVIMDFDLEIVECLCFCSEQVFDKWNQFNHKFFVGLQRLLPIM